MLVSLYLVIHFDVVLLWNVECSAVAIVPVVLDAINFVDVEHHQWQSYGGWTWALQDYTDMNIMVSATRPNDYLLFMDFASMTGTNPDCLHRLVWTIRTWCCFKNKWIPSFIKKD